MTTDNTATDTNVTTDDTVTSTDRPIEELIQFSDYTGFSDIEIKRLIIYFRAQQKIIDDAELTTKINIALANADYSNAELESERASEYFNRIIDAVKNSKPTAISTSDLK